MMEGHSEQIKVVYSIIERGPGAKPYWMKIGIGKVNRDGSLNLKIDAWPAGKNEIHVRDYTPFDADRHGERQSGARREVSAARDVERAAGASKESAQLEAPF